MRVRAFVAFVSAAILMGGIAAGAGGGTPRPIADRVGRAPGIGRHGPVLQPVNTPARIARVAVVPHSTMHEAWGIGFTDAPLPGFERYASEGATVFAWYRRDTGWQVFGPPVDRFGNPAPNVQLSSIAFAPNGEGYAVGFGGAIYHYRPGATAWREHPDSALTANVLYDVALGFDGQGVYGYAVGQNLTFLRLGASGRWSVEQATGSVNQSSALVPEIGSVAVASRDVAYAVSYLTSQQLWFFVRGSGTWQRKLTGDLIFDSPPAPVAGDDGQTVNRYATGSGVAAFAGGAWITGEMQPFNATATGGDDPTRPFVLRYDARSGVFTSYCPRIYRIETGGVTSQQDVCDQPFPAATRNLPFVQVTNDGVFAGGFGLFRFAKGRWTREPDSIGYVVDGSFASGREGWVATSGDAFAGGGGLALTTAMTLGHWTERPAPALVRRWPVAITSPFEAIALSREGDAFAAGQDGVIARHVRDVGWEPVTSPVTTALHAIAWSSSREAWAVGGRGTIVRWNGSQWLVHEASGKLTSLSLYGVAFRAPDDGVAVGQLGTILRWNGSSWRVDAASRTLAKDRDLTAVVAAGRQLVAVGMKRTMLIDDGRGFASSDDLDHVLPGRPQALLAAAALPDGTVIAGGAGSIVVQRDGYGRFRVSPRPPLNGTVTALAAARDARDRLRLLASVSTGGNKVRHFSDNLADATGWLLAGDDRGWRDASLDHARAVSPASDAGALRDPVYAVALDPGAATGWAVGGYPKDVTDSDGHSRATSTASIWRFDRDASPGTSPSDSTAELRIPRNGVSFAFLANSSCADGLCGESLGNGARGETVLSHALADMSRAAPYGVRFVAFGGDMRRNGILEELQQVRPALRDEGLPVPVWAALGDRDLFAGLANNVQQGGLLPSNGHYLQAFAEMPQPWGTAPPVAGFRPVGGPNTSGRARTYYAFDYAPLGEPLLRVAFLDTSQVPLARSEAFQNPLGNQVTWLRDVFTEARARGIPTVLVMHQADVAPLSAAPEAPTISAVLSQTRTAIALAGHDGTNRIAFTPGEDLPGAVPVGLFGGGGAKLGDGWRPESGAYHSWQLVSVDSQGAASVRSIPIIESAALHALDGRASPAGGALRFKAVLRMPDAGGANGAGPNADPAEGRATYLHLPFPHRCGALENAERAGCVPSGVVEPDYRFTAEDPSIAAFVREDPDAPGRPFRDAGGNLVADGRAGLLCTFRPGATHVRVESGLRAARVPLRVTGGDGPCIPGSVVEPFAAKPLAPQPRKARLDDERVAPAKPKAPQAPAVAAVPVPPINPVPAPPGAPGVGRKEEHEVSTEQQGHGGTHASTALERERSGYDPIAHRWWVLALIGLTGFAAATGAASLRARSQPAPALVRIRHNGRST